MKRVTICFLAASLLCGCTMSQQAGLDKLDGHRKEEEANRAAIENCAASGQPDCWTREYRRHLTDPIRARAEDSKEHERLSAVLLAEWSQCEITKARELAHSAMAATQAVREAFRQCDKERETWVRAQGSTIYSQAEYVASGAERSVYPILLGFIEDIRNGRRS